MNTKTLGLLVVLMLGLASELRAASPSEENPNTVYSSELFEGLEFRPLDFTRGGRSTAVAGIAGQPLTYYFGSTGGGVWKTEDGGNNWRNVSDKFFKTGAIGSVAVAPSDPNVVYVGTGSACPRGNISPGIGMYRSTDAGKTWKRVGLEKGGQIGRIVIHPRDPDVAYAAVLGNIFGPNPERGVFRSLDGGNTWENVLFISEKTGAVDLAMDPNNSRVLFAAMWTAERKPWTTVSGSEEGGIYKSTDSGSTWEKLSGGLPGDLVGKIGISVSGADSDRVWAIIEANKDGGVYRSDDAGKTWRKINEEARLRQRPWYYNHIYADPQDENVVYVLNTGMYKSTDGGRTFQPIRTPHGDNHDLWISPQDNGIMIEANDGGVNVSFDGGESWSSQNNQPTAEIYRVAVDNQFPYRVYGAQQDNSTISVPSRGGYGVVPDWYEVGGCESGHIAVDPRDPDIVYAGCYGGDITRVNRKTGESRPILVYPQLQLGQAPRDLKYRFQWNAPIRISPHHPGYLYHTSQYVHLSRDEGQSWETISPDLTRNEKSRQGYAGGPISHDSTGVEVYGVIFAFEESPYQEGLLWAGSDDGRVHVSRDGGKNWKDVTPDRMPEWGTVNMIELSPYDPGRAFIAVHLYRENDFSPYVFRTNDFGQSWDLLTDGENGIPSDHFVRVVREDPDRKGLLYAGTEFGLFLSFDDGAHWQPFQLNLPVTPVTDLTVHAGDLVVATQGRAFWILDDVSLLHQLTTELAQEDRILFEPGVAYRSGIHPAQIRYYLAEEPTEKLVVEILDDKDAVLMKAEGDPGAADTGAQRPGRRGRRGSQTVPVKKGLNTFLWNLRRDNLEIPDGVVIWGGGAGARVIPATYKVRLTAGDWSRTHPLEVRKDPRNVATLEDFQEQEDLLTRIQEQIDSLYKGLQDLREARSQIQELEQRLKKAERSDEEIQAAAEEFIKKLEPIEEELTQTKSKSDQDPLNFPPKLDNQLVTLYDYVAQPDNRPTGGAYERFEDLRKELEPVMEKLSGVLSTDVASFNQLVQRKEVGAIVIGKE